MQPRRQVSEAATMMLTSVPNLGTIVPRMGTDQRIENLAETLFGRARMAVLVVLLRDPEKELYLREVVRAAGVGQGAVQRELANLVRAGIAVRNRRGNQVFYQANRLSPVFDEIRSLVTKTAGVADVLRQALRHVSGHIRVAFIFGSIAKGTDLSASDIDVMIVGELTFAQAVGALREPQDKLGREINPSVFPVDEFAQRMASRDHFISSVLAEPEIYLIGGEDELAGLASERLADAT